MSVKNTHIVSRTGTSSEFLSLATGNDLTNGKQIVIDFILLTGSSTVAEIQSISIADSNSLVWFTAKSPCAAGESSTIFIEFEHGLPCSKYTTSVGTSTSQRNSDTAIVTGVAEAIDIMTIGYHYEITRG